MPRSLTILGNPDTPNKTVSLTDGVKYVPYYEKTDDYELTSGSSIRYELDGTLPSGLSLNSSTTVISVVPVAVGTWKFQVRQDNTDDAVQQQTNDYLILKPVGSPDPNNPNHFYKDEYTDENTTLLLVRRAVYRICESERKQGRVYVRPCSNIKR